MQYTQCPECQSVFKVTQTQLMVADGWARCSRCNDVFNALDHFVDKDKITSKSATDGDENKPPNEASNEDNKVQVKATYKKTNLNVADRFISTEDQGYLAKLTETDKGERQGSLFESQDKPVAVVKSNAKEDASRSKAIEYYNLIKSQNKKDHMPAINFDDVMDEPLNSADEDESNDKDALAHTFISDSDIIDTVDTKDSLGEMNAQSINNDDHDDQGDNLSAEVIDPADPLKNKSLLDNEPIALGANKKTSFFKRIFFNGNNHDQNKENNEIDSAAFEPEASQVLDDDVFEDKSTTSQFKNLENKADGEVDSFAHVDKKNQDQPLEPTETAPKNDKLARDSGIPSANQQYIESDLLQEKNRIVDSAPPPQETQDKLEQESAVYADADHYDEEAMSDDNEKSKDNTLLLLLVASLSVLLILQLVWSDTLNLIKSVPVLCELSGCEVVESQESKIEVIEASFKRHPQQANQYILEASLINPSEEVLSLPTLNIIFNNMEYNIIGSRAISLVEQPYWMVDSVDKMEPQQIIKVRIVMNPPPWPEFGYNVKIL